MRHADGAEHEGLGEGPTAETRRKVDLDNDEVYCPYLLSSVLFLCCGTPRESRAAVGFLRTAALRITMHNEELSMWATLQKTKEQKDRPRRLMRVAACVQANFQGNVTLAERYRLVCWKSGVIMALDMCIAKLVNNQVAYDDTWWSPEQYKGSMENNETQIKEVVGEDVFAGLTSHA